MGLDGAWWKYIVRVPRDGGLGRRGVRREAIEGGGVEEEIWVDWLVMRMSKEECRRDTEEEREKVVYGAGQRGMTWRRYKSRRGRA